jgi:putative transposase
VNHRGYKFRIYPAPEQEAVLRKTIGSCRFVYNWALAQRREAWVKEKKSINYAKSCKALTELKGSPEKAWLNEVSSVCLQQSLNNLDVAFGNFFKKRAAYPSFKARKNGGSARFTDNAFRLKGDYLFLAKIKTPFKVVWSRPLSNIPNSVTVSQNASGQWFASFLCEEEIAKLPPSDKRIGIDAGIENFATLSDGRKFQSPKAIRKLRKKLARLQRRHSRKKKGSKNRERARKKVARVHQRIADVRKDFLHKLSTQLVRENQAIALEDLSVSSMVKNRKLSRVISEQGWREFRTILEYKCEWYGRELLIVDRWFPSSKTCSCCGAKASFGLEIRQWTCGACGASHDRDVNAAKNILAAGQAVSDCGVDGRPTKNYVLRGRTQRSSKTKARASKTTSLKDE